MRWLAAMRDKVRVLGILDARAQNIQEALGRIEARQLASLNERGLIENEFKVYSQWGEDGIIQHLLRHIRVENKCFVEFGVENYTEANTRFLLVNDNWSGLVIDGNEANVAFIKRDPICWQRNLRVECAFITKDNINELLKKHGVSGEIGILSVDIDGNDYWVWEAIDCVSPAITIVEYNARFGQDRSVTVPYSAGFVRAEAHYSMIYYGASLKALCSLADKKGYAFVGCNSAGNNAFFVRRDLSSDDVPELSIRAGYVRNKFREARDMARNLTYLSAMALF